MDSDQGAPAPSQTAGNGNAAVLLGLYLLLLAFFILLVAISRIVETRSSAALNSVNGAFSAAVEATAPTAFAPIVTGPIVEIEEFQGRIRAAVEEALPVAEVLVVQSGRVLRVRISMNVAFVRDEARLSRAMPPLLARLAGAMGPAAQESRAEIELRVGVRDTGAPTAAGGAAGGAAGAKAGRCRRRAASHRRRGRCRPGCPGAPLCGARGRRGQGHVQRPGGGAVTETDQPAQPAKGASNAWLITFADLAALLLTFFVLLFSMSQVNIDDWGAVKEALGTSLNPQRSTAGESAGSRFSVDKIVVSRAANIDYL